MKMRREGKEVAFQDRTYSLKTINNTTCFYLIFTKIYSRKNKFRFSKQNIQKIKRSYVF